MIYKKEDFYRKYLNVADVNEDIFKKIKEKFKKLGFNIDYFTQKKYDGFWIYAVAIEDSDNSLGGLCWTSDFLRIYDEISVEDFLREKQEFNNN